MQHLLNIFPASTFAVAQALQVYETGLMQHLLNIFPALTFPVAQALATATGRSEQRIKDALKQEGDLGIVAVKLKSTQKTFGAGSKLTVRGVFKVILLFVLLELSFHSQCSGSPDSNLFASIL
jgi:hypothetical protein